MDNAEIILNSRTELCKQSSVSYLILILREGGCGVTGFICSIPVTGRISLNHLCKCTIEAMEKEAVSLLSVDTEALGVLEKSWTRTICYTSLSWIQVYWRTREYIYQPILR